MLENEGFTDDLRKTFLVFLISHQRPFAELLDPHRKDLKEIYEAEFTQMALRFKNVLPIRGVGVKTIAVLPAETNGLETF